DIIDVPKGQHGFDMLDHTDESRAAVTKALDWAIAHLGEDPAGQLPIPAASASTPTTTTSAAPVASVVIPAPTPVAPAVPASQPVASVETTPTITAPVQAPPVQAPPVLAAPVPADTPAARVVGREHAAYEAHDLEAFLAMYSPTAQLQLGDGSVMRGRRSLREYYQPRFEAGQCKTDLLQRMTQGEWVVDQTVVHDSDQGPAPVIALYRVQEGLIVEVRFLAEH
ncbi:MAG TPA: nuclear transport factor 2 family protein, partial [Kribbella sp.]